MQNVNLDGQSQIYYSTIKWLCRSHHYWCEFEDVDMVRCGCPLCISIVNLTLEQGYRYHKFHPIFT